MEVRHNGCVFAWKFTTIWFTTVVLNMVSIGWWIIPSLFSSCDCSDYWVKSEGVRILVRRFRRWVELSLLFVSVITLWNVYPALGPRFVFLNLWLCSHIFRRMYRLILLLGLPSLVHSCLRMREPQPGIPYGMHVIKFIMQKIFLEHL